MGAKKKVAKKAAKDDAAMRQEASSKTAITKKASIPDKRKTVPDVFDKGMKAKKLNIGGQAVLEGVMMKSPHYVSISVRKPDGSIKTKTEKYISLTQRIKILSWPFLRGVINLYEMLVLGMKALSFSANEQAEEEDEKLSSFEMGITIAVSVVLGLGLFLVLPYILTMLFGLREENQAVIFNLVDGIIKLGIFVAYIYVISRMKDIRRVFEYHGAEHKLVHAYESAKDLTVANARKFTTLHKRCGTSFLFIVIVTMILLFSVIPVLVMSIFPGFEQMGFWAKRVVLLLARLFFIIPVAGISYEILKLSAKYEDNILMRALAWPGLLIQKMTTKEPNDSQLEVAYASIRGVIDKELSHSSSSKV